MAKKKILFDATHIGEYGCFSQNGSGIYFVTYNILLGLLKQKNFQVLLYCAPHAISRLKIAINRDKAFENCTIFNEGGNILDNFIIFLYHYRENLEKKNKRTRKFLVFCIKIICKIMKIFNSSLKIFNGPKGQELYSNIDIFFSPVYAIPDEIRDIDRIKKYTILYDLIPLILDEYKGDISGWMGLVIKSINADDNYFAISQCAKNDFIKYLPVIDPDKVNITLLAAAEHFFKCFDFSKILAMKGKYKIPSEKRYFLNLSSMDSRKNLQFALECFAEFIEKNKIKDLVFVLAGGSGEKFITQNADFIKKLGISSDQIIVTGYVANEDIAALYSAAECFVFPSLYEGFGLPVLEAMQCGCPVITSNNSSIPEVVGDAGIMINPLMSDELIAAYKDIYNSEALCNELSQKGLDRAKLFSWSKCVNIMTKEMLK